MTHLEGKACPSGTIEHVLSDSICAVLGHCRGWRWLSAHQCFSCTYIVLQLTQGRWESQAAQRLESSLWPLEAYIT